VESRDPPVNSLTAAYGPAATTATGLFCRSSTDKQQRSNVDQSNKTAARSPQEKRFFNALAIDQEPL
jgi:hypothetical protein